MDERELYNDPEETLRAALRAAQANIWTALPGIIQSFDAAAMTAVVQIALRMPVLQRDGTMQNVTVKPLLDCPVVFPQGGGFTLTFPVAKGDECLVVFSSRCIDAWWQLGGIQTQAEFRMHDLSDGFALMGARSQLRVLSGLSTSAAQLRSDDGETYVEVADGQITVNAASAVVNCETAAVTAATSVTVTSPISTFIGDVVVQGTMIVEGLFTFLAGLVGSGGASASATITGNVSLTGSLSVSGDVTALGTHLHTHTHTGVTAGSDTSGPPT